LGLKSKHLEISAFTANLTIVFRKWLTVDISITHILVIRKTFLQEAELTQQFEHTILFEQLGFGFHSHTL
jgi:hypothetical protein